MLAAPAWPLGVQVSEARAQSIYYWGLVGNTPGFPSGHLPHCWSQLTRDLVTAGQEASRPQLPGMTPSPSTHTTPQPPVSGSLPAVSLEEGHEALHVRPAGPRWGPGPLSGGWPQV